MRSETMQVKQLAELAELLPRREVSMGTQGDAQGSTEHQA